MKKQLKLATLFFTLLLLVISCEKESITQTPITSSGKKLSTLTSLYKSIAPPMQSFTVTAGTQKTIVGEKGTRITFYPSSFKSKNGQILTTGTVNIVLQEMLTGPEMILAGKSTTSDGKLLQSGGQIYVNAYSGGEELLVNSSAKPKVMIPASPNSPNMDLYVGETKESDSVKGDTTINWSITKDTVSKTEDTTGSGGVSYYYYNISQFGFSNCDALYHYTTAKTDIKVIPSSGFVDSNCNVFAYFPIINGVAYMYYRNNQFTINYELAPIGLEVKLIMVGRKENKLYYEIKTLTVTNGMVVNMNSPIEATEQSIQAVIKSM